jgi:hypothetical protein
MPDPRPAISLDSLRYEPLADRLSKVSLADLGRPGDGSETLRGWSDRLPSILAANSPMQLCDAILTARARQRPVLAALGGHVIKTGCGPYLGSAVILPEVFLKTVSMARNLGFSLEGLTTANLDFQQQYRGRLNVLERPGGQGIAITGHHELMIPLLHAAVISQIRT